MGEDLRSIPDQQERGMAILAHLGAFLGYVIK